MWGKNVTFLLLLFMLSFQTTAQIGTYNFDVEVGDVFFYRLNSIGYEVNSFQLDEKGIALDGNTDHGLVHEGDILQVEVKEMPEELHWNQLRPPDPEEYPLLSIINLSTDISYVSSANHFIILFVMMVDSRPNVRHFDNHEFDAQGVLVDYSGPLQFNDYTGNSFFVIDVYVTLERISGYEAFVYSSPYVWVIPVAAVLIVLVVIFVIYRWRKKRIRVMQTAEMWPQE